MKKIIAIAAILTSAIAANAQTVNSSATQTVNLALANAIEITFTGSGTATGAAVSLAFNTVNDYANGVQSAAQTLKVRSNKNYTVAVKANSTNFSYSGSTTPAPVMPVGSVLDLKVSANATGGTIASPFSASAFADVTAANQNLLTNCPNGGNQTFAIIYNATPGFSYPAGTYSADIVYTATQL